MSIAQEIKETREFLKMSRVKFGEVMGVDRVTVYRWEHGKRNPTGSVVRLLDLIRLIFQI